MSPHPPPSLTDKTHIRNVWHNPSKSKNIPFQSLSRLPWHWSSFPAVAWQTIAIRSVRDCRRAGGTAQRLMTGPGSDADRRPAAEPTRHRALTPSVDRRTEWALTCAVRKEVHRSKLQKCIYFGQLIAGLADVSRWLSIVKFRNPGWHRGGLMQPIGFSESNSRTDRPIVAKLGYLNFEQCYIFPENFKTVPIWTLACGKRNLRSVPFQRLRHANFGIFAGDMDIDSILSGIPGIGNSRNKCWKMSQLLFNSHNCCYFTLYSLRVSYLFTHLKTKIIYLQVDLVHRSILWSIRFGFVCLFWASSSAGGSKYLYTYVRSLAYLYTR